MGTESGGESTAQDELVGRQRVDIRVRMPSMGRPLIRLQKELSIV
jgi:hypothetical protein